MSKPGPVSRTKYSPAPTPSSGRQLTVPAAGTRSTVVPACLTAIGRGAQSLEKHFTLDKGMTGPDHALSMTPTELRELSGYAATMSRLA